MKTIVLCLVFCVAAAFVHAQEVVLGAQGGFGSTWLINNNVSDQAENLDQVTSFAPMFGIEAGYLLKTTSSIKLGVIVEGNYAPVNQEYSGKDSVFTYAIKEKINYIQVPVLFHLTGNVFFFEAGPQFSFLSKATEDFETTPSFFNFSGIDTKSGYESTVVSVAFGIGGHFNVAPNLYVDTRLRFAYGLTDATVDYGSETARETASDLLSATYGGLPAIYANTAQKGEYAYEKTSLATGHLLIGLTYRIPTVKKDKAVVPR